MAVCKPISTTDGLQVIKHLRHSLSFHLPHCFLAFFCLPPPPGYVHLAENQAQTCPSDWANLRTWHPQRKTDRPAGRQMIQAPSNRESRSWNSTNFQWRKWWTSVWRGEDKQGMFRQILREKFNTDCPSDLSVIKHFLWCLSLSDFTTTGLYLIFPINLYWELWSMTSAPDGVARRNKIRAEPAIVQLTTHATQTPRVVAVLQKAVAVYRHSSSPLLCDVLLLGPNSGPLAITAAQFSE